MNKDRDNRKEALGELVRFALVGGLATLLQGWRTGNASLESVS